MNEIISHTKCQKCQKVFNVMDLKENPEGIGQICIDGVTCRKREQEKTAPSNQALKPSN
ncbi:hypothetical protein [Alcaligenes sp. SMD-FA]|uniref:hypothetical protein n=1 Tax=Alcaligenes sp. SMD-FA TaxID=2991054 RepID=UPI002227D475|nr:hypothetical protein [Alcaligenes sp. SMD-FA]UYY88958.1 hypothetical protein OKX01_08785 [Alcaligenes sp. SMD-FA]